MLMHNKYPNKCCIIMLMRYFNKYAMNFQEILQNSSRIPGIPVDFQDIQGC